MNLEQICNEIQAMPNRNDQEVGMALLRKGLHLAYSWLFDPIEESDSDSLEKIFESIINCVETHEEFNKHLAILEEEEEEVDALCKEMNVASEEVEEVLNTALVVTNDVREYKVNVNKHMGVDTIGLPNCPNSACQQPHVIRSGKRSSSKQRYQCTGCGKYFSTAETLRKLDGSPDTKSPEITVERLDGGYFIELKNKKRFFIETAEDFIQLVKWGVEHMDELERRQE